MNVLLLLAACSNPDDGGTVPADPTGTTVTTPADVPWVLETEEPAVVDLDAIVEVLQDGLDLAAVMSPAPILDAYRDLAAGADSGCPTMFADDGYDYWLDICTAGSGTSFDGFGLDDEVSVFDGYGYYDLAATGGAGRIEDAGGTFLELDGFAQLIEDEQDGISSSTLVLDGTFATNHPAADGTWLEDGLRPSLVASSYVVLGAKAAFSVVGAIDELGPEYPAVAFDDNMIIDPGIGYGGCAEEPTGVLSARLPSGQWVDVVFDPYFEEDVISLDDAAACDGCGEAWYRDVPLGRVCLDFSSWL